MAIDKERSFHLARIHEDLGWKKHKIPRRCSRIARMACLEDFDFSTSNADAALSYPQEAGQIKKGGLMLIHDHPCKVTKVDISAPGKHGHSKCSFCAIDIFTNKKYEDMMPSSHNAYVPYVERTDYTLININDDDFCSLLHEDGTVREDIKLPRTPQGMAAEIVAGFKQEKALILTVLTAMGNTQIVAFKEDPLQRD